MHREGKGREGTQRERGGKQADHAFSTSALRISFFVSLAIVDDFPDAMVLASQ